MRQRNRLFSGAHCSHTPVAAASSAFSASAFRAHWAEAASLSAARFAETFWSTTLPEGRSITYTAPIPAMTPARAARRTILRFPDFAFCSDVAFSLSSAISRHFFPIFRQIVFGAYEHERTKIKQPDVGRPFCLRARCDHGRDQCINRFRPQALCAGYSGLARPCSHARKDGHHCGRRPQTN